MVEALETEVNIGTPADSGGVRCCDASCTLDEIAGSDIKLKLAGFEFVGGALEDQVGKTLELGGRIIRPLLWNKRCTTLSPCAKNSSMLPENQITMSHTS